MSTKNIYFDDKKKKNPEFYKKKKSISDKKVIDSKKEPYGKNNSLIYFIGYDIDVIRQLCLRLPQMTGYAEKFDENATMPFRVNNKQLLKNNNKIWEKVEKLLRIDLESKSVYGDDDKYIILYICRKYDYEFSQ